MTDFLRESAVARPNEFGSNNNEERSTCNNGIVRAATRQSVGNALPQR